MPSTASSSRSSQTPLAALRETRRLTRRKVRERTFEDDPAAFVTHVGGLLNRRKIDPDPWQVEVLQSDAKQKILNTSRQIGKSTVIGGLCLHKALYEPESETYVFAPTEKQAKETFAKIARFYRAYAEDAAGSGFVGRRHKPTRLPHEPGLGNVNVMGMVLPNGSKIHAMPGTDNSSRGFSADLLVIDEAAFARTSFYSAIRPSVAATKGDVVLASTPNGKRGFFHHEWIDGDDWARWEIPATLCPRISAAFLAAELKRMGERAYLQEYHCVFTESNDAVFNSAVIADAFSDDDVEALWLD